MGEEGQKKFKKGINIFSKKGFLRGGTNVAKGGGPTNFYARLRAQIVPPLNKSPRTPLSVLYLFWQYNFNPQYNEPLARYF